MSDVRPITLFLPTLEGGGAQKVMINLAGGLLRRGEPVEILIAGAGGELREEVSSGVSLIELGRASVPRAFPELVGYIRARRPRALISALYHADLAALAARGVGQVPMPVICTVHSHFATNLSRRNPIRSRVVRALGRVLYPRADAVVAVSDAVAEDVRRTFGPRIRVQRIDNPIVGPELIEESMRPVQYPWFDDPRPTIISAGRLTPEKDYELLIRAFEIVRREIDCRLVILGEGPERPRLEAEVARLELRDAVLLPGFVPRPYSLFRNSAVFALSSRTEGLPTVLIEAMACGCTPVALARAGGAAEALGYGQFGRVVAAPHSVGLAAEIVEALRAPHSTEILSEGIRNFGTLYATDQYLRLIASLGQCAGD